MFYIQYVKEILGYLYTYNMTPRDLAMTMIQDVLKATGITATAGIGTNMYLCKVALDITAKHIPPDKDGVRIAQLDMMTYRRTLWTHRDLTDFWMVGAATAKRLNKLGLYTMGDVARCSLQDEERLYREFGKNAVYLIDQAWGREPVDIATIKAYKPESTSTSSGQVLTRPYSFDETRIIIQEMVDKLVLELVEKGLMTDQIVLMVGYDIENLTDAERRKQYQGEVKTDYYGRKVPKHAHGSTNLEHYSSSTEEIMSKVMQLYDKIVSPDLLIRRITITANHIIREEQIPAAESSEQIDLFTDYHKVEEEQEQNRKKREKERKLQEAMLSVKKKYGKNAMLKGTNLQEGATTIERNRQFGGHKA